MSKNNSKKVFVVEGTVRFAPNPNSDNALAEKKFKYSNKTKWGYNIGLIVEGQKANERFTVCACDDSRAYVDGQVKRAGAWVKDLTLCLREGDFIRATAYGDKGYNGKKQKSQQTGKVLHYRNYWVSKMDQIEVILSEDSRPEPIADDRPEPSKRPRG